MENKAAELVSSDNNDIVNIDGFARICKALGHPARVKIIKYLKEENRCICGQIVEILPLAQSTVSQHLKSLKEAGLVRGEVEGLCNCYCIDLKTLEDFKKMAACL
jgi:predicted transcriptional regulator